MSKTFSVGSCFLNNGEYFMITKGEIEQNMLYDLYDEIGLQEHGIQEWVRGDKLKVQKMKWVYNTNELIPFRNFQKKEFLYLDEYVLIPDNNHKEQFYNKIIFFKDVHDISKISKYVKYVKFCDKNINYDITRHTVIVHNQSDRERLRKLLKAM